MPRIWFLILRHQVWLLDILLAISCACYAILEPLLFSPYFSWENIAGTIWGRQKECRVTVFLYWQLWSFTSLSLPCMLILWCYFHIACFCFYFFKTKKKLGENAGNFIFSFLGMSDIACIFAWYLNSLCINWLCLDMIESLWLYNWQVLPVYIKDG
jgi:hypothetical protein